MSNVATVPAHIAARIAARQQAGTKSAITSAIVGEGGASIPRISIRAGRYRLNEDGVETTVGVTLDTIIVGANNRVSKVFYGKAFDAAAENVRPDCWSNDGLKPDGSVASPVHTSCADCPNNVLGSKILPSGFKSRLCADQRHLAVVAAADPSKVYSLTVPVSGMTGLREYFKDLSNYGISPEEVVTELGFDDQASYPKITFKQKGYVPEKAISRVDSLLLSDSVKIATREMAPTKAGPALSAPSTASAMLSHAESSGPTGEEAYEGEEPIQAKSVQAKPMVSPVKASDELAAKIDSLFDE